MCRATSASRSEREWKAVRHWPTAPKQLRQSCDEKCGATPKRVRPDTPNRPQLRRRAHHSAIAAFARLRADRNRRALGGEGDDVAAFDILEGKRRTGAEAQRPAQRSIRSAGAK